MDLAVALPETMDHPDVAAGCVRCPALVAHRRRIVHGYGDPQARIMIIGEAPGYLGADRTGVPFTSDRTGRRLQTLLIALGLSQEVDPTLPAPRLRGVYLTNVVRCNPPGNRNPTAQEVANCASYLRAELAQVCPQAVVTLGSFALGWAFRELLGRRPPRGVRSWHGSTWQAGPIRLLVLVHPARASREEMRTARLAMAGLWQNSQTGP